MVLLLWRRLCRCDKLCRWGHGSKCAKGCRTILHLDERCVGVCCGLRQGREFTDGQLYFKGRRCRLHQQSPCMPAEDYVYGHVRGTAVLHIGKHRHGARPITSGSRSNMILWCRSSLFRSQYDDTKCAGWCGLYDSWKRDAEESSHASSDVPSSGGGEAGPSAGSGGSGPPPTSAPVVDVAGKV